MDDYIQASAEFGVLLFFSQTPVMSLQARRALYFKFCVAAKFRLTPAPTSASEIAFLHSSFAKLATLEHFHIQPASHTAPNAFNRDLSVVLNPFDQESQLDPFSGAESAAHSVSSLLQRQREIAEYLNTICGIPRFSYVQKDDLYFSGNLLVPFKHTLVPSARYLTNEYAISSSTIESPFAELKSSHSHKEIVANMRHNFQKYHKIEPVYIEHGWYGLQQVLGLRPGISVKVDADANIDVSEITNLERQLPATVKKRPTKGFEGFESV